MVPIKSTLLENLGKIAYTLDKAYLSELADSNAYRVLPFNGGYNDDEENHVEYESNIRAIRVNRWVFNKDEKPGDCLKNILSLFADGDHSLALVVVRKPKSTEMYFVVKNSGWMRYGDSRNNRKLLNDAIQGNFPGTQTCELEVDEAQALLSFASSEAVAVLCNTPSEYSEDYISQGLDKLLNGIVPGDDLHSYAVVFLADSLKPGAIRDIVSGFEEIATAMHPFVSYQFQVGKNQTDTQGEMSSIANTEGVSESVNKTHSVNVGVNAGFSFGDKEAGFGFDIGGHAGYGYSWGKTEGTSSSETAMSGSNSSVSVGTSENTSYTYKSYMVADLIQKTEKTIQRIMQSQATGLWKFATYVFARDQKTCKNVANYMRAVTQGKESYIEPSAIQAWSQQYGSGKSDFEQIRDYVTHFTHPVFCATNENGETEMCVTPTAYVGTDEVSHVIAFPRKSVPGLPVLECASFGRNVTTFDSQDSTSVIKLGKIFHMHRSEKEDVLLSLPSLASHTFVTGSTGSGKSTTVYKVLDEVVDAGIKFLVVEPAKGEYKHAFGNREDVAVYGTNPAFTQLLQLDPFAFPATTHVLEHLDRLVEIFNVCWPMYAAMPAVLKDAIERSYADCGWNLVRSSNPYGEGLFPSFADVARNVRAILDTSEYDAENKGAYKGSLLTRLNSLTNGINGMIFSAGGPSDDELFENNVIVDLSRVGSAETKALIMGVLVLKLQEHRMDGAEGGANAELKHLTVLEEAHHLLKRTSTEQPSEGGNLLGKSVEMLTSAIAEMRTYGEGFIVVDQAPGLLDMAAIRNTNTKIIMRLPDQVDRELVGRAANLNDDQIREIARLPRGVAAIYQNEWIEPVLCKVELPRIDDAPFVRQPHEFAQCSYVADEALSVAEMLYSGEAVTDRDKLKDMTEKLVNQGVGASAAVAVRRTLEHPPAAPRMTKLGPILSALFPDVRDAVVRSCAESAHDPESWTRSANEQLLALLHCEIADQLRRDIVQAVITDYLYNVQRDIHALEDWSKRGGLR